MKGRGTRLWLATLSACLIGVNAGAAPVVLSVDRLYRSDKSDQSDLIEAGEILLTELHCVNCHAPGEALGKRIPIAPAPSLQTAGSRLRDEFLREWLANPHATDGRRMPDVMAGLPAQERAANAEALAQFIESFPQPAKVVDAKGDAKAGRELFHSIGCVACHAPRAEFAKTAVGEAVDAAAVKTASVPLENLAKKYTAAGLVAFLLDPHAARPAGRMPGMNLTTKEAKDIGAFLRGDEASTDEARPGDISTRLKGQRLFASLGCVACHAVRGDKIRFAARKQTRPLEALIGQLGGCLATKPQPATPWFDLDNFQRQALAVALLNLRGTSSAQNVDLNHRRMVSLNCYACHQRDGVGGPDDARLKYFVSSGSDLGDEGRVPPLLTGVGRKLRRDALEQVIQGRFPVRPYMTTRMPAFPEEHARLFATGFATADHDPNELPTPRDGEENQVGRNMWGRALLGTAGLSCVTCHQLNGRKSLGIQAMDLAHSTKRLRAEWFRDYLIDPPKFRPGTRMPSFWPNGKPLRKGNGNTTSRQIDSIWAYLGELDQSRLPEGMEKKGNYLLTPKERPIVFRTFMESAGMHAIAVGFPEQIHAAFDSQTPRWAMAWTGRFLDTESTWDDRFTPLAKPEGNAVIAIQPLPTRHGDGEFTSLFRSYRVRRDAAPELSYRVHDAQISDSIRPAPKAQPGRLIRTIGKVGTSTPIWFEVANGKRIEKTGAGIWQVDGKLTVRLPGANERETRIVNSKDGRHLQFLLKNTRRRSLTYTLTLSYDW